MAHQRAEWHDTTRIRSALASAVADLDAQDADLFALGVGERSIVHHLAHHLDRHLAAPPAYRVDVEYNRSSRDAKVLAQAVSKRLARGPAARAGLDQRSGRPRPTVGVRVFPDLIVHRRGSDDNVLAVEVKIGPVGAAADWDAAKLLGYRDELGYASAVFLNLHRDGNHLWQWWGRTDQADESLRLTPVGAVSPADGLR